MLSLAAFCLALIVAFGFFATMRADRVSLEKQKIFIASGIVEQVDAVVRQQTSVTVWDDSVVSAKQGDQAWMSENLGVWMYSYYGHDRVYVLDAAGQPVYAMSGGHDVPAAAYEEVRATLAGPVATMRALLAEAAGRLPTAPPPILKDMVVLSGVPAILAIQPLVPSSNRVLQTPGTEYLHIDIRFIDQKLMDSIAGKYSLAGAHLLPQAGTPVDASVPLADSHGTVLGYFAWTQDKPGLTLIREASPALLAGLLLTVGVLYFLLSRLRRASTALQASQSQTQYLAFHDTLTGLPNRALFEDRLKRALLLAGRERRRASLLYIDLDRFKHVNDTLGHPAGDELVRQTAMRLERAVREVDTVARLGGDEFAVILFDIGDVRGAEDLCERLLLHVGMPFDLMGDQVFVSASIGVAMFPDAGADPADLLRKADIALYEAKRKGRGRYEVFAGDMDDILARKRMVESDLRASLTTGEDIRLVYQPIFANDCRTVLGAEALIRWDHPLHSTLSPSHFVTIAEERGMIGLLGDWVLREAARFIATTDLAWVAVNVSPLQLRAEGFAARLMSILAEAGADPTRLQIEITEGILLENSDGVRMLLAELREAGIRIALDDFGTGYSSISYLRRHAIDKLKIDRSFVRLLGTSQDSLALVRALVDLAKAVNVRVTAEGVETVAQRDLLVAMGCHELQGYLLSQPLSELQAREFRQSADPAPSRHLA